MIAEIGQFSLLLALGMALLQGTLPLAGAHLGIAAWTRTAHTAVLGQVIFLLIAYACLTWAFVTHDFSIDYVAGHSNSGLPLMYRISGVWGGHEGSLLLWAVILAGWSLAVSLFSNGLPSAMAARTVAIMGLISVGILSFTVFTSNPFALGYPVPPDGRDLNPLLQDPGLIIHPPMLYMGYVGLAVPFAIAVAALIEGRLDAAWARWSRPWTTTAWAFLGLGIALGSWWAYYTLGWGGWWFWDPVENASLMPFLAATALIHSLAATEKRGAFRSWTVLLAIVAFSLSLLGTFLVRSGVLVSVHAFATDPERGLYILLLLGLVVGSSLSLYAWRAPAVMSQAVFRPVSREGSLLANNVVLSAALGAVLLGTLYPLLMDALGMGRISVGPPYFDTVFAPLMLPLIFLAGLGPLMRWKKTNAAELTTRLRYTLLAAVLAGIILPLLIAGSTTLMASLGLGMAFWLMLTIVRDVRDKLSHRRSVFSGLVRLPASWYGMHLSHLGLAILVIGITVVSTFEQEQDVRMAPGDTHTLAGYDFTFHGVQAVAGPNFQAQEARVSVARDGNPITELRPQRRIYRVQRDPMTNAAIDTRLGRDLFVALGRPMEGGAWSLRIYHNPFQVWLWIGAGMIVLGGFTAAADRRYRMVLARREARLPEGAEATTAQASQGSRQVQEGAG